MYRVCSWDEHYENNRTREIKSLGWVKVPNRLDGDGYTELVSHKDGAAHYGAWVACLAVASRCTPRGSLVRDGGRAHDAESLSRITRIPAATIAAALTRLVAIGWVEVVDAEGAPLPAPSPDRKKETVGDSIQAPQETAALPQDSAGLPQEPAALTQDGVAKRLRTILGSSLNVCRDQVRSLVASGMALDMIDAAVTEHGAPGVSPWDWTRAVSGRASNGHSRPDYVAAAEKFKGLFPGKDGVS